MPTQQRTLEERRARIEAVRARLERRREGAGIADLLAAVNEDLDAIVDEDRDAADRAYDKIEARLAAERIRIEDDAEEGDR
jgi:uncharacterized protein involved in exopolysaccharide biosynthesis